MFHDPRVLTRLTGVKGLTGQFTKKPMHSQSSCGLVNS